MIAEVVGNYRLLERIGRGGMGEVYLAEHRRMPRRVAIKVLLPELSGDPALLERFFMEARSTAVLDHPGIVKIIDCDVHEGRAFIVMEYLEGEPLSVRLRREGRFGSWSAAVEVGRQIAQAVGAAHAKNIVHRDLKPDNVFLAREGEDHGAGEIVRVKILDFGIAKLVADGATLRTRDGALLGTPTYMAPEQCRDARSVDHRADIYSFGCILFEMLAGRPPFVARGFGELIALHLSELPPSVAILNESVPVGLADLVGELLAKRPDARPPSMVEVSARLSTMKLTAGLRASDVRTLVMAPEENEGAARRPPAPPVVVSDSAPTTGTLVAPADVARPSSRGRRTTTLSQAVGELSDLGTPGARRLAAPRRGRKGARLVVPTIGLGLGAAIAFAVVMVGRRSPLPDRGQRAGALMTDAVASRAKPAAASAGVGASAASPPAVRDEILVDVIGAPDGLQVSEDGNGVSLPLRWPRGSDEHHLLFRAIGYRDKAMTVLANRSRLIDLQMQRQMSEESAPPPVGVLEPAAPAPARPVGVKSRSRSALPPSARTADPAEVPAPGAGGSYDPDGVARPAWAH